ncbi:MAG: 50S ribosomal protein L20 [Clostridia bacterium]
MARIKRGVTTHRRHKKILKLARGYFGSKSKLFKTANQAVMRSMAYATAHRRKKKGDFRKLWIQRINAAVREHGMSYSRFINAMKLKGFEVNRKMLADLAVSDPKAFAAIVEAVK